MIKFEWDELKAAANLKSIKYPLKKPSRFFSTSLVFSFSMMSIHQTKSAS